MNKFEIALNFAYIADRRMNYLINIDYLGTYNVQLNKKLLNLNFLNPGGGI